jgi:hypothetical protein
MMNGLTRFGLTWIWLSCAPVIAQASPASPLAAAALREGHRLAAEAAVSEPQRAGASSDVLELRWSELPPLLQGRRVDVTLTDGTTIRGDVLAVRDEELVVDVRRASRGVQDAHRQGNVPRTSVSIIRFQRSGSSWGRNLGTVIGVLTGVVVGAYVAATTTDSAGAGIPTFLAVASGFTLAGYYSGRHLDRTVSTIRVMP